jgi:hypothetical protein
LASQSTLQMSFSGLPTCSDNTDGKQCVQSFGDGGVYYDAYQACSTSTILLPGFNLLPSWFVASTIPLTFIVSLLRAVKLGPKFVLQRDADCYRCDVRIILYPDDIQT